MINSHPIPEPLVVAELADVTAERDRLAVLVGELTAAVGAVLYRDFSTATDPARAALHALRGLES